MHLDFQRPAWLQPPCPAPGSPKVRRIFKYKNTLFYIKFRSCFGLEKAVFKSRHCFGSQRGDRLLPNQPTRLGCVPLHGLGGTAQVSEYEYQR